MLGGIAAAASGRLEAPFVCAGALIALGAVGIAVAFAGRAGRASSGVAP
jgi:hypothetical protein